MGGESLELIGSKQKANYRVARVSGYKTDLLEIHARDPALLHVLFIPGNPGVINFYTDFFESLHDLLGGTASVTAIGHISHSEKDWENGKLFSLQEQIDHKVSFIEQEFKDVQVPLVLVGHSIGAYICLEVFKRYPEKVSYCICIHPFLALNPASSAQVSIGKLVRSPALSVGLGCLGAMIGMLPFRVSSFVMKNSITKLWSPQAVKTLCTHVLKYHSIRNVLFMAKTEFENLPKKPEVDFIRIKKSQAAFLFGLHDHWGPLQIHDEIACAVTGLRMEIDEDGNPHDFSCTEAGSLGIAKRVSGIINNFLSGSS